MKKRIMFRAAVFLLCGLIGVSAAHAAELVQSSSSYQLVFAIDNSQEMKYFDCLDDLSWMDALVGYMEQTPQQSAFAFVTQDDASAFGTAEGTEELMYQFRKSFQLRRLYLSAGCAAGWSVSNSGFSRRQILCVRLRGGGFARSARILCVFQRIISVDLSGGKRQSRIYN